MRILILSPDYPPNVYGGVGVHVESLAISLAKLGHEVTVICLGIKQILTEDYVIFEENQVQRIEFQPDKTEEHKGYYDLDWSFRWSYNNNKIAIPILHLFQKFKFEIIHVHDHFLGLLADILVSSTGCPMVTTIHSMKSKDSSFQDSVRRYLCKRSNAIIAVSQNLANEISLRYQIQEKLHIIHNGMNLSEHRAIRIKDQNMLCFCGRMSPEKACDILIKAFFKVSQKYPAIKLQLIGDGDQKQYLQELADTLGMAQKISFMGYVDPTKVMEIISEAYIQIIPSNYEPFGLTAIEAMHAGNCVIAAKTGGLQEIISHNKDGILFEPGNVDDLAYAIDKLLSDKSRVKRLIDNAKEKLIYFSGERMALDTEKIYKEII